MKSYGEFCALARALDVIGDRWTMLVVRELLVGPSRYSDLNKALPGIATNLLAARLRTLEEAGVVASTDAPAPVSARVYSLTEWGQGLQRSLVELARWGVPLMSTGAGEDHSRGRWLVFAVMALYPEPDAAQQVTGFPTVTVRIDADGDSVLLVSGTSGVRASVASAHEPAEVIVEGTSEKVFRTLSGGGGDSHAEIKGDADAIRRFSMLTSLALTSERGDRLPA
ncbi:MULTISPECIES: winged helix-turn-helix transcriptional regulator [Rhodococcus]|uniref:Helix-turn-helix transcriptional regulator n=1 Tax=Rhodococcus qingshengii JCM 15477 TaxID=1303681 RepID=A0AB38RP77_RHOSG|nr:MULTISPECIES: helix-turn-helix domain-containing protein [Rhodococcus]MCC4306738.1 helix-turn-helix transcriptional regulator [Rhodococcus sp. 3-2]OMQ22793.1 transcriptional regulator [Rhodococcus sp. D-1]UPU47022.1 helix-turn-helix transcriptional regulator [Rhodococcus qingshengii JCM 15477]